MPPCVRVGNLCCLLLLPLEHLMLASWLYAIPLPLLLLLLHINQHILSSTAYFIHIFIYMCEKFMRIVRAVELSWAWPWHVCMKCEQSVSTRIWWNSLRNCSSFQRTYKWKYIEKYGKYENDSLQWHLKLILSYDTIQNCHRHSWMFARASNDSKNQQYIFKSD